MLKGKPLGLSGLRPSGSYLTLNIAISSGKGGTGKTFVATNIARVLANAEEKVRYLDCDVEAPDGHLFFKPETSERREETLMSPSCADETKCDACGKCARACRYHAIALIGKSVLFFKNLCHVCGACTLVCPHDAIVLKERKIGELVAAQCGPMDMYYATLETGEGGMTPRLIRRVKEYATSGINILDSPPGTSCPVVETVKDTDICVLVTDPTPFGLNDLKLAVDMCRELNKEPVIVVNRANYTDNNLREYCLREELEIVGEIPDDRRIAECYSSGGLVVDIYPEYEFLVAELAKKIIDRACAKPRAKRKPIKGRSEYYVEDTSERMAGTDGAVRADTRELVVISGKGGTGKTSLVAAFCALEKKMAIADCDVDAADLHILLDPRIRERGLFSGGEKAAIDMDVCTSCGDCFAVCRFNAVLKVGGAIDKTFSIDDKSCEGCGVCGIVCKSNAVIFKKSATGEWFVSDTRFGPMSHAKLDIAEGSSGKLVSLIRKKKKVLASSFRIDLSIIDGSPGTGCPVIASITGTDYAVVVTEPTVSGIHDLKRILDVVAFFKLRSGIIVNKYDLNPGKAEEAKEIARLYNSDFLGMIPYDRIVTEAQMKGVSVVEYSENATTLRIREIWETIRKQCFNKPNGREL